MTETSGVSDTKTLISQRGGKLVAVPIPDIEARQREPICRSVHAASLIDARPREPGLSDEGRGLGSIVAGAPERIREAFDGPREDGLQCCVTGLDLGALRGYRQRREPRM